MSEHAADKSRPWWRTRCFHIRNWSRHSAQAETNDSWFNEIKLFRNRCRQGFNYWSNVASFWLKDKNNSYTTVHVLFSLPLLSTHLSLLSPAPVNTPWSLTPWVPHPGPSHLVPHPVPSPWSLTTVPHPGPSPWSLTLVPHTGPSPWSLTPIPHPGPSPVWSLTLVPDPSPAVPHPGPSHPGPSPWSLPVPHPDPSPWSLTPVPYPDPSPWSLTLVNHPDPSPVPYPDPSPWSLTLVPHPDPVGRFYLLRVELFFSPLTPTVCSLWKLISFLSLWILHLTILSALRNCTLWVVDFQMRLNWFE